MLSVPCVKKDTISKLLKMRDNKRLRRDDGKWIDKKIH